MINKLRHQNKKLIAEYSNGNNEKALLTQKVISNLLKDDDCFLKLNINEAYTLLTELKVSSNKLQETYISLIKPKDI